MCLYPRFMAAQNKMSQTTVEPAEGRFPQIDDTNTVLAHKLTQEIIEQEAEKLHLPSTIKECQCEIVSSGKSKEVELGKQSSASKLAVTALRTVVSKEEKQQQEVENAYLPGQWVIDINQKLKENNTYDGGKSWSIYRVPERLRQIQESAFAPKLVSIGPFHHNANNLQAGNEHKMRFLVRLLGGKFEKDDTDTDETNLEKEKECRDHKEGMIKLEELEKAMKLVENKARACYSEAFNDITSDEFVQMMVLDGCFIIEVLRLHYHSDKSKHYRRRINKDSTSKYCHNVNDPIFHSHWMIQTLQSDFLMFENQLPMFILEKLFSLTMVEGGAQTKLETLGRFFFSSLIDPTNKKASPDSVEVEATNNCDYDHLLNLFRDDFTRRLQEKNGARSTLELAATSSKDTNVAAEVDTLKEPNEYLKLSYHARELQEAGVEIVKKKEDKDGILKIDIDGANKSIIKMHPLYLDDTSAVMLLNFLAYEQCHHLTSPYFSNYIVFLDCLIDNECDVEVLHKAGVLNHAFGNNNDVANLINRVGREIVCDPNYNYLHSNMEALNKFCKSYYASRLRTWWRNLIRNYFSTPWTAISLVAAVFLLILTLMQTFYAMYAYYLQPRSTS